MENLSEIKAKLGIKSKISKPRVEKLINAFNKTMRCEWKEFDSQMNTLSSLLKEDEIKLFFCNPTLFRSAICPNGQNDWYSQRIIQRLIMDNYSLGDYLLENSDVDVVKVCLLSEGVYSDLSLMDKVALGGDGKAKAIAAQWCSIEVLRKIKDTKDKRVQEVCFQRLGPVECLDQMLSAKYASVRSEGLARAPMNYHKLKDMTGEIARHPFSILVRKIPFEYLPMLLANRNVKRNNWMQNLLEERLNRGR